MRSNNAAQSDRSSAARFRRPLAADVRTQHMSYTDGGAG